MEILENKNGKELTLVLNGRLDTVSAPSLDTVISTKTADVDSLIFDLKALEYISSAGLRVLLKAQKVMNIQGKMKIINANDLVKEVFEITGFSDILTIE